jgi:hypothetical protein
MAIDSSIALGVRPLQLENPLAMYSTVAGIQNAQNQNALAQYTLAAARRGEETENALNKAYMKAYNPQTGQIDLPLLRGEIAGAGVGSKLPAIEKQLAEFEKEQLARQEQLGKLVNQKFDQSKGLLANVRTPEEYIAWHEANHADPVLGKYLASRGVTAEQSRAQIMAELAQPGGFQRLVTRSATALDKMPELLRSEQEQAALAGRAPTAPMAAPATNALAPTAPQAQPVANAMVASPQTSAVPTPAVTAMPATSGLQGELSAVNSEIARLAGSEAAGLPGVQNRIKALEEQKARLFTAITQERNAATSEGQARVAAQRLEFERQTAADYRSSPAGVVKIDKITGEATLVKDANGKPIMDVAAAQAAEAARHAGVMEAQGREQLNVSKFNAKIASDRQKLEQWKVDNPEKEIKEADGVFVAVDKRSGKATPITVGGKPLESGRPLNEAQGSSVAYGIRMKEANSIIERLASEGTERSAVGAGAQYGIGGIVNALPSALGGANPQQQQFQQAKLNFITAVLRKESGAAIGQDEFEKEDQKYFRQVGDSDAVAAQKKQARQTAIKAMEIQAGPGAKEIKNFEPRAEPSQPISAPKVGAVQDGYKFKGGDPSKPSSWEKL